MSNRSLTAAFQHSTSKGSARLVLLAMADEANDEGLLTAYRRSHSWLAKKANVDAGTVRRSITTLVELGEVVVLTVGDGRASSDYRLTLPGLADEGVQVAPPGPAPRTPRARRLDPQGAQVAPPIIPLLPDLAPATPVLRASGGFAAFWSAYPRGDGKPAAIKAWERAVKVAPPERIMEGLAAWLAFWTARNEPEFVPWAQKWLNQQQWFAEPPPLRRTDRGPRAPITSTRDGASGRVVDL